MSSTEIYIIVFVIFLLMSLPGILARRKQIREMDEACSELAHRIGMKHVAPLASPHGILFNLGSWTIRPAAVKGTYQGFDASISMTGTGGGWAGEYAQIGPSQYTVVSLEVMNTAQFRLTIKGKGFLSRFLQKSYVTTSNSQFNQSLVIRGKPQDFLQRVASWIPNVALPMLAWIFDEKPRITLKGSVMTCKHGLVKDMDQQISILKFLCDMADMIERSGSNSVVSWIE